MLSHALEQESVSKLIQPICFTHKTKIPKRLQNNDHIAIYELDARDDALRVPQILSLEKSFPIMAAIT